MNYLKENINEIYKSLIKALEYQNSKPTYQEVKNFLQKLQKQNFYLVNITILKKLLKWADTWIEIA